MNAVVAFAAIAMGDLVSVVFVGIYLLLKLNVALIIPAEA